MGGHVQWGQTYLLSNSVNAPSPSILSRQPNSLPLVLFSVLMTFLIFLLWNEDKEGSGPRSTSCPAVSRPKESLGLVSRNQPEPRSHQTMTLNAAKRLQPTSTLPNTGSKLKGDTIGAVNVFLDTLISSPRQCPIPAKDTSTVWHQQACSPLNIRKDLRLCSPGLRSSTLARLFYLASAQKIGWVEIVEVSSRQV